MAVNTSLRSIEPKQFGYEQAQHLLNRVGFGGPPRQVSALVDMGLRRAVDHLVDFESLDTSDLPRPSVDPDVLRPPTDEQRQLLRRARREKSEQILAKFRAQRRESQRADRRQIRQLRRWWLSRMIATTQPLEEKLTLMWHGHFATNYRTVRDCYLMLQQQSLLRRNAIGSFADLVLGIIHDPAMIRFLDNHNNRKQNPNENLARELMELFTLGEGNYAEADIKEGARALTGYSFHDNDFVFHRHMHDAGAKQILGRRGRFDGDQFARILLEQKACPRFVSYRLYKHFVADVEYDQLANAPGVRRVIDRMARLVVRHKYRIRPVLKVLFRSMHFYDQTIVGNKIKSPAQLLVGTVRMLNLPVPDLEKLVDAMRLMGQTLFDPPSVAGWAGGRSWINTSTLFVRQNLCAFLITGKRSGDRRWTTSPIGYDPMFLVKNLPTQSHEAVVDHLLKIMLVGQVPLHRRAQVLAFVQQRHNGELKVAALLDLLLLVTAMPEYQLC